MAAPAPNCTCGHRLESPPHTAPDDVCIQSIFHASGGAISSEGSVSGEVFCKRCSTNILAANIARYNAAIETQRIERADFERRLLTTRLIDSNSGDEELTLSNTRALPDPSHIHKQVYKLKQRLDRLRSTSNELAIRVTSKTMDNDERQNQYETSYAKIDLARERLDSMRQNLLLISEPSQIAEEKKNANSSLEAAAIGGGLRDALVSGTKQIQTIRFHFALRVFEMHRIDVGDEYTEATNCNGSNASGVGKIGGLPLPHAGPALYGVLPPGMLASSLRLVASLTNLLASCLGVVLPHPILVCSKECDRCGKVCNYGGDVIDALSESDVDAGTFKICLCTSCERDDAKEASEYQELQSGHHPKEKSQPHRSSLLQKISSKSSVLSFVGSSARKAVAIATGSAAPTAAAPAKSFDQSTSMPKEENVNPRTVSADVIARRISHASFAVLLENHESGAAEYILNPPRWKEDKKSPTKEQPFDSKQTHFFTSREEFHAAEEKFATGLQLLQNNVIALCFRAGVDASTLWPAESMLLNLYSLLCHCVKVVESNR